MKGWNLELPPKQETEKTIQKLQNNLTNRTNIFLQLVIILKKYQENPSYKAILPEIYDLFPL